MYTNTIKKTFLFLGVVLGVTFFSGCQKSTKIQEGEAINPLNPSSMVNTYENSKEKINAVTQKQNDNIDKALNESGINHE
jgi:hypothetical protein